VLSKAFVVYTQHQVHLLDLCVVSSVVLIGYRKTYVYNVLEYRLFKASDGKYNLHAHNWCRCLLQSTTPKTIHSHRCQREGFVFSL